MPFTTVETNPDVIRACGNIVNGLWKPPPSMANNPYMPGKHQGLYNPTVYDSDACSSEVKITACKLSPSIVSLTSLGDMDRGELNCSCSGIWVEKFGSKKILTSAYILGGRKCSSAIGLEVHVLLANRHKLVGTVSHIDENHNLALIHLVMEPDLESQIICIHRDTFATDYLVDLGVQVVALGRHTNSNFLASCGKVKIRDDHLESDNLMASTCTISQWAIGGPLINTGGIILGINFFSKKQSTPFMPSCILLHCLDDLYEKGNVYTPWLGLIATSLSHVKIHELEFLYSKLHSLNGILVRKVTSGSPAERAGICVNDNIISCNNIPIDSPVQLADLLFKWCKSGGEKQVCGVKRKAETLSIFPIIEEEVSTSSEEEKNIIQVVVQNPNSGERGERIIAVDYSPSVNNSWPVLPYYPTTSR